MRNLGLPPPLLAALLALPLLACVPKDKYDAAIADAQQAHAKLEATEKAREGTEADLRRQLADAEQKAQDLAQKLSDLSTVDQNLQAKLDESTAINAQLRAALERLGKNVDAILQEKGTLSKALDDAKGRLDELRKAQAAAEARAQLFKQFIQKLKSMIDAGQLRVTTRAGRLVISAAERRPLRLRADRRQAGREASPHRARQGARHRARSIVPGRRRHRQPPHPDATVPLELGALDGSGGRGRPFSGLPGR